MKQFIFPVLDKYNPVCGVYKMIFDDGSFYIGSSVNLRQRFWGWKFKLESGVDKNYKVTAAFKITNTVTFEILDTVDDHALLRYREEGFIKINFGKPNLLNIASSAFSNEGIKQNPNKKINTSNYKPVVKVDSMGKVLEKYASVSAANKANNTVGVNECFKNSKRTIKGMIFRLIDNDGGIIPSPPPPPKVKAIRKKGYKMSEKAKSNMKIAQQNRVREGNYKIPAHSRAIIKYDLNKQEVERYPSLSEAARSASCKDARNLRKVIQGRENGRIGYYKGFFYKYA